MKLFRHLLGTLAFLGVAAAGFGALGGEDTPLDGFPPVVVKTSPLAGAADVDPSIREISVTFSKDMMTQNMWSWVIHAPKLFPKISGPVRYLADGRTNVAPVRLAPNSTYAIWFNSPDYRHNAFRDRHNKPAVPFLLVFRTGN